MFRPDWENAVGPVVDFALTLPGVDPKRIALWGISMGGLLAPRAAAFEHRLAAVVAVDGVYDWARPCEPKPATSRTWNGGCVPKATRKQTP